MLREVCFVAQQGSDEAPDDGERGRRPAPIASAVSQVAATAWLLDTGASDHVTSGGLLRVTQASSGVLQTAAGPVPGGEVGLAQSPLGVVSGTRQMPGSPNLLSLGVLAMKRGYGFRWDPFQRPVLVHPGGREDRDKPGI